jgi:hypothetical protein
LETCPPPLLSHFANYLLTEYGPQAVAQALRRTANSSANSDVPPDLDEWQTTEWEHCRTDPAYFISQYILIEDTVARAWIRFALWPSQAWGLDQVRTAKEAIVIKPRQIGWTWLILGLILWLMIFHPIQAVLLFSKRDDEAAKLVDHRLTGMVRQLPEWLKPALEGRPSAHRIAFANGSRAEAFPTTDVRSYSATFAFVDEADYVPDLQSLLNAVQPTVDAGGQLVLLSTTDEGHPTSPFKKTTWRPRRIATGSCRSFLDGTPTRIGMRTGTKPSA